MAKGKRSSSKTTKPKKEKVKLPEGVFASINSPVLTASKAKQGMIKISKSAAKKIKESGNVAGLRISLIPKPKK